MQEKITQGIPVVSDELAARKARLAARLAEINASSEKEQQHLTRIVDRAKAIFILKRS